MVSDPKIIEAPKEVSEKSQKEFDIVVMPKEFLGRESQKNIQKQEVPISEKKPEIPKTIIPPPSVALPKKQKKKSKGRFLLVIFGFIVVVGFAVAGYFVVQSIAPDEQSVVPELEEPVVVVEEPIETEEPVVKEVLPGKDTDSDGLTDREEILYRTDFRNPDTDADSFNDGNEVFHLFDPLGYAPSTLLDTGSVVKDNNSVQKYTIFYPSKWVRSEDDQSVKYKSQSQSYFTLDYIEFENGINTFDSWYRTLAKNPNNLRKDETKDEFSVYTELDELTAYIVTEEGVFVFVYELSSTLTVDYTQTFKMMVNSFSIEL